MDENQQKEVKVKILQLATTYGKILDRSTVEFYSKVICQKLTIDEFDSAIFKWAMEKKSFPAPAELIHLVQPKISSDDEAQIIVNSIIEKIKTEGWTWVSWKPTSRYIGGTWDSDAKAKIGEMAVHVINAWGGWLEIHNSFFNAGEETVWRAQLRDFVETQVRLARSGRLNYRPTLAIEEKKTGPDQWQVKLLLMDARQKQDKNLENKIIELAGKIGMSIE